MLLAYIAHVCSGTLLSVIKTSKGSMYEAVFGNAAAVWLLAIVQGVVILRPRGGIPLYFASPGEGLLHEEPLA